MMVGYDGFEKELAYNGYSIINHDGLRQDFSEHMYIYISIYVYLYIYMYMCL